MSEPFGFSFSSDDNDRDKRDKNSSDEDSSGSNSSQHGPQFGFFTGNMFDSNSMGSLFGQLGSLFGNLADPANADPVNYELAKSTALAEMGSEPSIEAKFATVYQDALSMVDVWESEQTIFPSLSPTVELWTPHNWVNNTIPFWKKVCDPVARHIHSGTSGMLGDELGGISATITSTIGMLGGMGIGAQLGHCLEGFAQRSLISSQYIVPLSDHRSCVFAPTRIEKFSSAASLPQREVIMYLCARELAYHRLLNGANWLEKHLYSTLNEIAEGVRLHSPLTDELQNGFDPSLLSNPEKLQELLNGSSLQPKVTHANQTPVKKLELFLGLIDGWVDTVAIKSLEGRIESATKISEALWMARHNNNEPEDSFQESFGISLHMGRALKARAMWMQITDAMSVENRDKLWEHPDNMPSSEDVNNPAALIDRMLGITPQRSVPEEGKSSVIDEIEEFLRQQAEKPQGNEPEDTGEDQ